MTSQRPLRMSAAGRRQQLLASAAEYIGQHGVDVSLDDIAKQAGISPPLMRHYFKNRDGLLVELFDQLLAEILAAWMTPTDAGLAGQLGLYLDWVAAHPWAHRLWMAAGTKELSLEPAVSEARRTLARAAQRGRWAELEVGERFRANAWVAVVESSVQHWLSTREPERDELIAQLLDTAARLDIGRRESTSAKRTARSRVKPPSHGRAGVPTPANGSAAGLVDTA